SQSARNLRIYSRARLEICASLVALRAERRVNIKMETPNRLERVKEVFLAALDREPRDINSFLSEACEGDDALYRRVESLLAAYRQDRDFLQASASKYSATDVAARLMDADDEASIIGHRIGDYRIVREIGRGGMGALYLAKRDDGEYEQQAALK